MSEEKGSVWGSPITASRAGGATAASQADESGELEMDESRPSSQYDVVQIAPVERFNCMMSSGEKKRLSCWVTLRHKKTGQVVITGAVSLSGGSILTLAIDIKNVERFAPM